MLDQPKELIEKHIKTHTERSAEDEAAVATLRFFLRSKGRINPLFASGDKWPNIDGTFEYVTDPEVSRRPIQDVSGGKEDLDAVNNTVKKAEQELRSLGGAIAIAAQVQAGTYVQELVSKENIHRNADILPNGVFQL